MINYCLQIIQDHIGKGFLASAISFIFGYSVGEIPTGAELLTKWFVMFLQVSSFSVAIFVGVLSAISWFEKRKKNDRNIS